MMRRFGGVLALLAVTVLAQNDSFDLVDANNDGKLSESELITFMRKRGRPDGAEYFKRFDLDRNGHLDISEFVPLVYEMSRRPVDMDYQFFKKMDLNDDGIVDKQEVEKIRKDNNDRIIDGILSIADVNQDGQLTYEEFKSHLSQGSKLNAADEQKNHALQLLSFIDSNGDNRLDQLELYNFSQKTSTNKVTKSDVQQIFAMLDKNRDGFLTETELVQLAQQFSTIGNVRSTIPKV
uniref:EF hand n=1 Tax=Caenorhabditis tropicalis TaxID=1561998 RepID=A0A1I7UJZ2_9PELO